MLDAQDSMLLRQVFCLYLLFALLALPNMTQAEGEHACFTEGRQAASAMICDTESTLMAPGEPGYPQSQRFRSPTGNASVSGPGVFLFP